MSLRTDYRPPMGWINCKAVNLSSEGNIIFDNQLPGLNGQNTPPIDPWKVRLTRGLFYKNYQNTCNKIVSEGCTEHGVYKVGLGIFDVYRQERAWIAYKERVLTAIHVDQGDQENHLQKAAKKLNKLSDTKWDLEEFKASDTLEKANKLQEFAKKIFITLLSQKSEPVLIIENGKFHDDLDLAMKEIHLVFLRSIQKVNFSGDPEELKGIEGTPARHHIIWNYLSSSLNIEDPLITIKKLKTLCQNLQVTSEGKAFAQALLKKVESSGYTTLVSDLNECGAKPIADLLEQEMVIQLLSKKSYSFALETSNKISDDTVRNRCHLLIANDLWDDGSHQEAIDLVLNCPFEEAKWDWSITKADFLAAQGEWARAINLLKQFTNNYKTTDWCLTQADSLVAQKKWRQALELITGLLRKPTKDDWCVNKADFFWDAGEKEEAKELINLVTSESTRNKWKIRKFDEL